MGYSAQRRQAASRIPVSSLLRARRRRVWQPVRRALSAWSCRARCKSGPSLMTRCVRTRWVMALVTADSSSAGRSRAIRDPSSSASLTTALCLLQPRWRSTAATASRAAWVPRLRLSLASAELAPAPGCTAAAPRDMSYCNASGTRPRIAWRGAAARAWATPRWQSGQKLPLSKGPARNAPLDHDGHSWL